MIRQEIEAKSFHKQNENAERSEEAECERSCYRGPSASSESCKEQDRRYRSISYQVSSEQLLHSVGDAWMQPSGNPQTRDREPAAGILAYAAQYSQ
jgi:hypothetical protein